MGNKKRIDQYLIDPPVAGRRTGKACCGKCRDCSAIRSIPPMKRCRPHAPMHAFRLLRSGNVLLSEAHRLLPSPAAEKTCGRRLSPYSLPAHAIKTLRAVPSPPIGHRDRSFRLVDDAGVAGAVQGTYSGSRRPHLIHRSIIFLFYRVPSFLLFCSTSSQNLARLRKNRPCSQRL